MSFKMEVETRRNDDVLVRVLGLVRRRGFEVERLLAEPVGEGFVLRMDLGGDRPGALLARQLERLVDVDRVGFPERLATFSASSEGCVPLRYEVA